MAPIEEIIKVLDDELILQDKPYFILSQANKLLLDHNCMEVHDIYSHQLKKELEANKIAHAYQTDLKPRQWKIPLSPEGKLRYRDTVNTNKNQTATQTNNTKSSNSGKWILAFSIVILLIYFANVSDNKEPLNSTTNQFYINTATYAAKNEKKFDEMFRYFADNDETALRSLLINGDVIVLQGGTEVFLIESHLSYSVIRMKGSTERLWVVRENISKKLKHEKDKL